MVASQVHRNTTKDGLYNVQYKISLRLGLDILKTKQVTVKRPTLNKISRYCRPSLLDRRQLKSKYGESSRRKLEDKFQIPSLGKHGGKFLF